MPPASRVPPFLLVFASLLLFALALTIISEFSDVKWVEKIISIGEGLGRLTFAAVAITFILVEGIPMLAAWYKKEMVREAKEKGREEGRAERREAWLNWAVLVREWERRRVEAENEGRPFNDPPPVPPDSDENDVG